MKHRDAASTSDASTVRWVHTGIVAPSLLDVHGFNQLATDCGVAYSAELVHPTLGVVGRIANDGNGGETTFLAYDRHRFSWQDLEAFADQCTQDGEPIGSHQAGVAQLLDTIIDEAEYADQVHTMRKDGLFLIRSFEPRTEDNYGPHRGPTLAYTTVMLAPQIRRRAADKLAHNPSHRLNDGAYWQMYNGQDWVPLLSGDRFTTEQVTDRLEALTALRDASFHPLNLVSVPQGPIDGLYACSQINADRFTLAEDQDAAVTTNQWCRCRIGKPHLVRFEKWTLKTGFAGSGTIHAALTCRRLVRVD